MDGGRGITRRGFMACSGAAACLASTGAYAAAAGSRYSVAILGDTHYDAEPESVYHSHYDESNQWAKVQHEEFRRNGEMWRERCPKMIAASAKLAREKPTKFILQLGDIIQGDCDDVETHKKMMDDCIKLLRAPYPAELPFLTVIGNHDFRGKGARLAYFEFAEPFIAKELRKRKVAYPVFSFRAGGDLWVFCDFEMDYLNLVCDAIDADPGARHVFLVTHGPFTLFGDQQSYRWRLGGHYRCDPTRKMLYETLSRRHAIVLSGHTHTVNFYRHENGFGGFTEFTANSVWKSDDLATAKPLCEGVEAYAAHNPGLSGAKLEDFRREREFFLPGLREYFYNKGAGHYRLNVSDEGVEMEFYPGDATEPGRVFRMS